MTAVIGDIQYLHILKMNHTIIEKICWCLYHIHQGDWESLISIYPGGFLFKSPFPKKTTMFQCVPNKVSNRISGACLLFWDILSSSAPDRPINTKPSPGW